LIELVSINSYVGMASQNQHGIPEEPEIVILLDGLNVGMEQEVASRQRQW
jgi:hypothetical protein